MRADVKILLKPCLGSLRANKNHNAVIRPSRINTYPAQTGTFHGAMNNFEPPLVLLAKLILFFLFALKYFGGALMHPEWLLCSAAR